tara:strand:+ start:1121 stop:1438 length:318 start_codon:yes stop_codon:yes gene_type:complete
MPISRYQNFGTVRDAKTGQQRLETFPGIQGRLLQRPSDIIITLNDAQRIDVLADQHLGSGQYWWIICLLNDMVFPFGKSVAAGTTIRLPNSVDNFVALIQAKLGN